jgi:hypothetical protein
MNNMKEQHNYYIVVGVQCQSDVEAIAGAAEIAEAAEEFAELRECGTKRLICIVSKDGNILRKNKESYDD